MVSAIATALAVLAVGALLLRPAGDAATGADAAPAIRLSDLRDASRTIDLRDFRGRPVIVNFFASWCAPCKRELPLLRAAHESHGDAIAFLGIDHLDERDLGEELLDEHRITYPAAFDRDGVVARRYRLRGLPSTVFVGRDGRLLGTLAGELRPADLERWLTRLRGR